MSIARLMTQPLSVQTVGSSTTDAYNDQVSAGLGPPVAVLGYLEQTTSVEILMGRDTTVTKWVAYLPAATTIGHLDYISYGSQTFQVDGAPHHVYNPRTAAVSHIEASLIAVEG